MNKIFDTHCHPHLNKIKDKNEVIKNFFNNGGKYMTLVGTNPKTCKEVIDLANKYDGVYASVGIHPCDITNLDLENTINTLEKLLLENREKIVGIGECGFDYYWLEKDEKINILEGEYKVKAKNLVKKLQKIFFLAQIKLAEKYNLPIIIHNRDSKDDVYKVLKETGFKNFIFHCYSENLEYANKLLKLSPNCKISFSGIVTFKNAKEIQETAQNIPLKNILAETDSPYLTPTPFRGKEENEPIFTKHVIEKINELRGYDCTDQIFKNSIEIFGIK